VRVLGRFLEQVALARRSWCSSDITIASRIGSIGGLVTWANCWRK
jgi:hypothetical protein